MKKKGFTLIELLAVIVILAIIALIATPIVMNVIENAKKGAAERSADNYMDAVETAVGTERIDGNILEGEYTIQSDGSLCEGSNVTNCEKPIKIDMSGNKPSGGTIYIENGKVVDSLSTDTTKKTTMTVNEYIVSYDDKKDGYVAAKAENVEDDEEEEVDTTTVIYSWSTTSIEMGDTLNPDDYTTDPTTLGKKVYSKHTLDKNNKVIEQYACANDGNKETCIKGGDTGSYGYAENAANYTGNLSILKGLQPSGYTCSFNASSSSCDNGTFVWQVKAGGSIQVDDSKDSWKNVCYVDSYATAICNYFWEM